MRLQRYNLEQIIIIDTGTIKAVTFDNEISAITVAYVHYENTLLLYLRQAFPFPFCIYLQDSVIPPHPGINPRLNDQASSSLPPSEYSRLELVGNSDKLLLPMILR